MKDLSKEERLEQQILEIAEECNNKKWSRVKKTFFILCGVILLIIILMSIENGALSDVDIETCFYVLIGVPFIAGFVMFFSWGILFHIIHGAMEDEKAIAKKIGELNTLKSEKHNNLEDEKIKQLEMHIAYLENYSAHKCDDCTFLKLLKNNTEEDE